MLPKLGLALGLLVAAGLAAMPAAAAPPAAASLVPPDAVVALHIARPKAILDVASSPETIAAVTALPGYKTAAAEPGFRQLRAGVTHIETLLGVKWPEALHKLLGGGVLATLHPNKGVLVVVDAEDGRLLGELHRVLLAIAKGEAEKDQQPERIRSAEHQGVTMWSFGKNEAHAVVGSRLILSNQAALLKSALDRQANPGESLADAAGYQAAKTAAGPETIGFAFVDLKLLKQVPKVQAVLGSREQPLSALLLAGVADALRSADMLALSLDLKGDSLRLKATLDAKAAASATEATFAAPQQPGEGAMPLIAVPGAIARMSFYRDLHAFYAAKDKLFPERTSGLILFENMMGIFFSGRDLTDEVLAQTRPDIRLVVAQQKYDPAVGTPAMQLPAIGAVFHVRNPEKAGELAEEAWQKALGLVNFTRGQKGQPGMIIDRETHAGVKLTVARFSAADVTDKTDIDARFNFRPALARVGEYLVLASADALAKDLIDALQKETAASVKALAQTHSMLEVQGAALASILKANRESFVTKDMLDKGKPRERSESDFDMLIDLIGRIQSLSLSVGAVKGQPEATVELKFNAP